MSPLTPLLGTALLALTVFGSPKPSLALQPGTLPAQWAAGIDCSAEAALQVHAYNSDFYIIRESKCTTAEAPFVFLLMGTERALLMDTGAIKNNTLQATVDKLVTRWCALEGIPKTPLVVAHTHSHGDHTAGDSQFAGKPDTQVVVGTSPNDVKQFFGFLNWPIDKPTFDLGGRVLDIIAIPGHQAASIAVYDRQTGILLTGDSVYPGHLFVPSASAWIEFGDSMRRLVRFARAHPISHVIGNHIEFSTTDFAPYPWATSVHPNERHLEFAPSILQDILKEVEIMGAQPQCQIFKDFVIHPTFLCSGKWNG